VTLTSRRSDSSGASHLPSCERIELSTSEAAKQASGEAAKRIDKPALITTIKKTQSTTSEHERMMRHD
jgi:hypothetical protein